MSGGQTIPRARLHAPPVIGKREEFIRAWREDLMEGLATVDQMRQILGYATIRSVYDLNNQGMPFIKLGNQRLYNKQAVKEWLYSRECNLAARPVGRPVGRPLGAKNKKKRQI